MVKGTSRRVIVVDSPDTELFEQAIFIVRNDILSDRGVTAQMLVDEACRVARSCTRGRLRPRHIILHSDAVHWGILAVFAASLVWLTVVLV